MASLNIAAGTRETELDNSTAIPHTAAVMKTATRIDLAKPHPLMPYKGRKMFRFFVRVSWSGIGWQVQSMVDVIAPTAAAAANLVTEEFVMKSDRPFEVECAGPRGGIVHRYRTWDGVVGAALWASRPEFKQQRLSL